MNQTTPDSTVDTTPWRESIVAYRRWLARISPDTEKRFLQRLGASDAGMVEGAAAEACAWDFLVSRMPDVLLEEDAAEGGPDFRFNTTSGPVVVEVTNLTTDSVVRRSGLPLVPAGATSYAPLTRHIKQTVIEKAPQLRSLDVPQVLMVTTLHPMAGALCFQRAFVEHLLHSEPRITAQFDARAGEMVGDPYQSTDMEHSCFTVSKTLIPARQHVSAVVLAGFGVLPPKVRGALHPSPLHALDPSSFIDVPFCRFTEWPPVTSHVKLEWSDRVQAV